MFELLGDGADDEWGSLGKHDEEDQRMSGGRDDGLPPRPERRHR